MSPPLAYPAAIKPRRRLHARPFDPTAHSFSTPQAACYLSLSISYLELLRKTGNGPPWAAIGPKVIRYLRDDLDAWLASRKRRNTSAGGEGRENAAAT